MDKQQKRLALEAMKQLGITRCEIRFDGGGDSGQVESIEAEGATDAEGETVGVSIELDVPVPAIEGLETRERGGQKYDVETETWIDHYGDPITNMRAFIETFAYRILDETEMDWYNNDGGFGEITIEPADNRVSVDMNIRTSSSDHFGYELGVDEERADG